MVFFGFVFSGFNVVVVCFCVSGKVAEVLKCLFFPGFGGFVVGWFILVDLGLEGLGVFVVLVFVFLLFKFCFCLYFCFIFVLLLDCFWCRSCFVYFFFSSFVLFFVFFFCFLRV